MDLKAEQTNFTTERILLNCGLTEESLHTIKDTAGITRKGAQHNVPNSQRYLDKRIATEQHSLNTGLTEQESDSLVSSLSRQLQQQEQMFSRFKHFSEQRIGKLEDHLMTTTKVLKEMQETVFAIKSNQQAQNTFQQPSKESNTLEKQNVRPATKAIDRNNVAPSDVQVEDIFYCGKR